MKKILAMLISCLVLLTAACSGPSQGQTDLDALAAAKAWIDDAIADDALMSFGYDGKAYGNHIKTWEKSVEKTEDGWTVTYKKGDLTAWSEILLDEEWAALSWTNYFKNDGSGKSPVIYDIHAIDAVVAVPDAVLTSANGATAEATDFQSYSVDLTETAAYTITAGGGKSSRDNLPYFDLSNGQLGVIGGLGWTGSWQMDFVHDNGNVRITAGMSQTHIALEAGEDMRTPMVTLQFFKGDQDDGHNAWRQLILKSYTPIDSQTGEPIDHYPITMNTWGGVGSDSLVSKVKTAADYDVFWVDAGWYGDITSVTDTDTTWQTQRGNWYPISEVFPNGFTDLNAATEAEGKDLLIWLEFETAAKTSKLAVEHPEFMLPSSDLHTNEMIDLSNEECYQYMIDMVSNLMLEAGAEWWRMDFGNVADKKWALKDEELGEDRVGITEIKHVTNLYRFMDEMKERIPGLMIDICASGGQRLDLEMIRRGCALWRTDYSAGSKAASANADGTRSIGANLSWWLPLSSGGYGAEGRSTSYTWRSQFASGIFCHTSATDLGWLNTMMDQYYQMREMMTGNYYMLAYGRDDNYNKENAVYEFYVPEEGRGYILAFRPALSDQDDGCYILKGLDAEATYELEVADTGETFTLTGEQLMTSGLGIKFPVANLSHLIFFNRIS